MKVGALSFFSNLIINTIKKIKLLYILIKYNNYTIAEYFRKKGAQIGEGCSIIPRHLGDEPYLVKIGNHVTIAGGVTFLTHDGGVWIFRDEDPNIQVFGPIIIEDNCVIGQNAILFPNIRIGKNSIIGAGSVVISNIPPNTIAMGVPARAWSSINKYRKKSFERWEQQKPPNIFIENGKNWWNSKHYKQNREKLRKILIELFFHQHEKKSKD
ncbi:MAG: acyltransferase [Candidatus Helarchaeota archaeon]